MKLIRRSLPYVVVFTSSMGIMIIELVASRLVSKYFGSSLYTWTGVIGVVLGGMSLGNFLGGRLADRFRPRDIISLLLIAASALTFLVLALDLALDAILSNLEFSVVTTAVIVRSFVVIFVLFFLPSASLGTISPVMAKYALDESDRVGGTVGSIYAMSATGSIFGTFLSGYVLIPMLGIRTIVFLVGGVIAVLALVMGGRRLIRAASTAWMGVIAAGFLLAVHAGPASEGALYATDTQYAHLKVKDRDAGGRRERLLIMDGLIHNVYDPDRPDTLLYEYERVFAALARPVAERLTGGEAGRTAAEDRAAGGGLSTLTLGGGACVFPAYMERRYAESRNVVVEIDPEVIRIAERYFDAPEGLDIVIADARNYVAAAGGEQEFDLLFLDAFNSFSVPYHLTTLEFTEELSSLLAVNGLFMANCVDILELGGFLTAYMNTVKRVFPHVRVYQTPGTTVDRRSTFVIAAARRPLGGGMLRDEAGRTVAEPVSPDIIRDLVRRNGDGILTDDFAPVESLIAPVFLRSVD